MGLLDQRISERAKQGGGAPQPQGGGAPPPPGGGAPQPQGGGAPPPPGGGAPQGPQAQPQRPPQGGPPPGPPQGGPPQGPPPGPPQGPPQGPPPGPPQGPPPGPPQGGPQGGGARRAYIPAALEPKPKPPDLPKYAGPSLTPDQPNVSNEEQAGYDVAFDNVFDLILGNEDKAKAFAAALNPRDKVGTIIQLTMFAIAQADRIKELPHEALMDLTGDTVEMLTDLGKKRGIQYRDVEVQQATAGAWEGVMTIFGVKEDSDLVEDYSELVNNLQSSPEDMDLMMAQYENLRDQK